MRLNFSILWFDDSEEWLDSLDLSGLEGEIRSWGFEPIIFKVSTADNFNSHKPFKSFDLILVDLNLEDAGSGDEYIDAVRKQQVYTEVIFYSASELSNLWSKILEHRLEGIYVETRDSGVLLEKIKNIGKHLINKVLDLENMRGIVMAEVGDLDLLMIEIIKSGFSALSSDEKSKFLNKFAERYKTQLDSQRKHFDVFCNDQSIEGALDLFDSMKRWHAIGSLLKFDRRLNPLKNTDLNSYDSDVLHPRNYLGHGVPTSNEDGSVTFTHQGREFKFDDQVSLNLRLKIGQYRAYFQKLLNALRDVPQNE